MKLHMVCYKPVDAGFKLKRGDRGYSEIAGMVFFTKKHVESAYGSPKNAKIMPFDIAFPWDVNV